MVAWYRLAAEVEDVLAIDAQDRILAREIPYFLAQPHDVYRRLVGRHLLFLLLHALLVDLVELAAPLRVQARAHAAAVCGCEVLHRELGVPDDPDVEPWRGRDLDRIDIDADEFRILVKARRFGMPE